jgi:hypothetical protein
MHRIPCLLLAMVLAAAATPARAGNGFKFKTELSGAQEVPEVVTDTSGSARIRFDRALSEVRFDLRVRRGVGVIQAHIHCAPAGINGPVVVFLFGPASPSVDVDGRLSRGVATNDDIIPQDPPSAACGVTINNVASLLEALRQGRLYVNVHTDANPAGEVRGQLLPD